MCSSQVIIRRVAIVVQLSGVCALASAREHLSGYILSEPSTPLPAKPSHFHLIDEKAKTPEGVPNPCARWLDQRVQKALADRLQDFWPRNTWQQAPQFLNWAVWGYLSPDSPCQGDERLVRMMGEWIDTQLQLVETAPDDPKKRAKWQPRRLGFWSFHNASMPLLELLARPTFVQKVGTDRVEKWRQLCIENVKRWGELDSWNALIGNAETYVNIAVHPMAAFVHGWLLTDDPKFLRMAAHIVGIMARDQAPNGTFPYRHFGGDHLEGETMYYHSINVRGLYLYWWHTGSKLAEATLRKSVPYYPLRMAPKYHFEDATTIWWKDQWRTFWPNHIAMVAAVTGDGRNATIANEMARDNRSADRTDLVLGWHAYQQMALRGVQEVTRRNRYIIADPDVGGLRGRFGHFDFNFSTNSYSHTLAGAIVTAEDRKSFGALHRAGPFIRVAPFDKSHRTSPDYWAIGKHTPGAQLIIGDDFAIAASTYAPFQPSSTWRPLHRRAPWKIVQLWLYTPTTMVGLMIDEPTLAVEAREVFHQFRFIVPGKEELKETAPTQYEAGLLRITIHATNLEHTIIERVRRYALNPNDRRDWQISLSDTQRSPEHVAQAKPPQQTDLKLPDLRTYSQGNRHFSLVEIGPASTPAAETVTFGKGDQVLSFQVRVDDRTYIVGVNFHDFGAQFETTGLAGLDSVVVHRSWGQEATRTEETRVEQGRLTLKVREAGAFAVVIPAK